MPSDTENTRRPGDYINASETRSCNRCGTANLAWWKTTRAGRWVLVNTAPSRDDVKRARDVRYITPWSPHRCERELARRAADDAEAREAEIRRATDPIYEQAMQADLAGGNARVRELLLQARAVRERIEAEQTERVN